MSKINENYICFTPEYLEFLIKEFLNEEVMLDFLKNFDLKEIKYNRDKIWNFLNPLIEEKYNNTDFREIFEASALSEYYKGESGVGVCFELKKSVNKNNIKKLKQLIDNLEKNTDVDCAIRTDKGLYLFQLKDFHKMEELNLTTQGLIDFIKKSLLKYGRKVTKNLLVTLQKTNKDNDSKIEFHQVHEYFKNQDLGDNQILVHYNDNNLEMCIISVYPKLASKRIPINWREPDLIKKYGKYIDNNE